MTDDHGGGFRWNLTPGTGSPPPSTDETAPLTETPQDPPAAIPVETAADVPNSAPVDDWDVPTAASPIIGRSVFPLTAPVGPPALLPPPYVPPPAALESSVRPMGLLPPPYVPPPLDNSLEGVAEALGAHPAGLPDPVDEGLPTSDIDVLFGESKFLDYDAPQPPTFDAPVYVAPTYAPPVYDAPVYVMPAAEPPVESELDNPPATELLTPGGKDPRDYMQTEIYQPRAELRGTPLPAPTARPGGLPPMSSLPFDTLPPLPASALALYAAPTAPTVAVAKNSMPRSQKILLGVAGALVAGLALVALFLLGLRIGESSQANGTPGAATPTPTAAATTPATTPVTPPVVAGPVAPGDYAWNELAGGECLTSYESPWQETYSVVDCAKPHTAQVLSKSVLPDAAGVVYPAATDLQARTTLACSATTILDYAAAGAFDDIQLAASYPADDAQWDAGDRSYYCFVNRAGGGELAGSLAVPAP